MTTDYHGACSRVEKACRREQDFLGIGQPPNTRRPARDFSARLQEIEHSKRARLAVVLVHCGEGCRQQAAGNAKGLQVKVQAMGTGPVRCLMAPLLWGIVMSVATQVFSGRLSEGSHAVAMAQSASRAGVAIEGNRALAPATDMPHSSMQCLGMSEDSRVCHFRDLYYDTQLRRFLFYAVEGDAPSLYSTTTLSPGNLGLWLRMCPCAPSPYSHAAVLLRSLGAAVMCRNSNPGERGTRRPESFPRVLSLFYCGKWRRQTALANATETCTRVHHNHHTASTVPHAVPRPAGGSFVLGGHSGCCPPSSLTRLPACLTRCTECRAFPTLVHA